MCKKNGESTNHLLIHCEVVKTMWDDLRELDYHGSCLLGWYIS